MPERKRPRERLLLVLNGELRSVAELGYRVSINDQELPIRLLWSGTGFVSADEHTPGAVTLSDVQGYSGAHEYHWNPFHRETDKDDSWRGNVSYGHLQGRFVVEGETLTLNVEVRPSVLSEHNLLAMRATLASIADELLTHSAGRTRSDVGLATSQPVSGRNFQAQLTRFVEPLLPLLRRIGREPREVLAIRRPQRAGVHRPASADARSLSCVENRFVATAVEHWATLFSLCAATAREQSSLLRALADRALPAAIDAHADGLRRKAQKRESVDLDVLAANAENLAREIRKAVPWSREVAHDGAVPRITPFMRRDPRYYAVFQAWWRIRRERFVSAPVREASQPDLLASALFERWAVLVMAALLLRLDWEPVDLDLLTTRVGVAYDLDIRRGHPWVFRKPGATLRFYYEPEFHKVKLGKSLKNPFQAAIEKPDLWDVRGITFFSTDNYQTPDYVLELVLDDGRRALVIGDAIYCPVSISHEQHFAGTEAAWPPELGGKPRLEGKLKKVRDKYSAFSFYLSPDVGAVRAIGHLGFVVYPGPVNSADWIARLETGVVPFPLLPVPSAEAPGIAEPDRVTAILADVLEEATAAATLPTPPPSVASPS